MKNKQKLLLCGFVLFAIILISLMIFPISETEKYEYSPDKIEKNYSLYVLDDEHSLTQSFLMRGETLESLDFFVTGFDGSSSEKLNIKIKDYTDILYEISVPLNDLDPNDYTEIRIEKRLKDGHIYHLEFSVDFEESEFSPRIIVVPDEDSSIKYGTRRIAKEKAAIKYKTGAIVYNYQNMSLVSVVVVACFFGGLSFLKKYKRGQLPTSISDIYITLTGCSVFVLFLNVLRSHGNCISHFLFYDEIDGGMDFFNSIIYLKGNSPYSIFNTLYPPLANALFFIVYHCIPEYISDCWPLRFEETVEMRQTAMDLRTYQSPLFLFVLFIVFSTLFMCLLCKYIFSEQRAMAMSLTSLLSFGFLTAFDRGNIVVLSFFCTVIFVIGHDSTSQIKRELSYISLAIAAGLKIYPAIYGLLLIREKKWKDALRTAVYGVLSVILPCFLFDEKLGALKIWINVLLEGTAGLSDVPWIGNGMTNMVQRLNLYLIQGFGTCLSDDVVGIISICILLLMVLFSLKSVNTNYSVFLLTIVMCSLRPQSDYIFIYFLIPLFVLIRNSGEKAISSWNDWIPTLVILLFTTPLPLFYVRDESYPRVVLIQALYFITVIWTLCLFIKGINIKRIGNEGAE